MASFESEVVHPTAPSALVAHPACTEQRGQANFKISHTGRAINPEPFGSGVSRPCSSSSSLAAMVLDAQSILAVALTFLIGFVFGQYTLIKKRPATSRERKKSDDTDSDCSGEDGLLQDLMLTGGWGPHGPKPRRAKATEKAERILVYKYGGQFHPDPACKLKGKEKNILPRCQKCAIQAWELTDQPTMNIVDGPPTEEH